MPLPEDEDTLRYCWTNCQSVHKRKPIQSGAVPRGRYQTAASTLPTLSDQYKIKKLSLRIMAGNKLLVSREAFLFFTSSIFNLRKAHGSTRCHDNKMQHPKNVRIQFLKWIFTFEAGIVESVISTLLRVGDQHQMLSCEK